MTRTRSSRKTINLAARLERLEHLTGKNSCLKCRLSGRHWLNDPSKAEHKGLTVIIHALCPLCDQPHSLDVSDAPADIVEMLRVYFGSTLENRFTDHRAWAANKWFLHRKAAQRPHWAARRLFIMRRQLLEGKLPETEYHQPSKDDYAQAASPADLELLHKLRCEYKVAMKRKHTRLVAKYGENPFPDLAARINGAKPAEFSYLYRGEPFADSRLSSEMSDIELAVKHQCKCAEAEKIVLGQVTATTNAALAACEELALESVAAARHRHEAKEDERRRRAEEAERCARPSTEHKQAASVPAAVKPIPDELLAELQRRKESPGTLAAQQRLSQSPRPAVSVSGGYHPVQPPRDDVAARYRFIQRTKPPRHISR